MRLYGSVIRPRGRFLFQGTRERRPHTPTATACSWIVLGVALLGSCVDDTWIDGPSDARHGSQEAGVAEPAANGGAASAPDSARDASVLDGSAEPARITIPCGTAKCLSPISIFGIFPIPTCCADEETSTCGLATPSGACMRPFMGDPRCPALTFRGIVTVPSCCTESGACGLDATMYGLPGCTDLAAAAEQSRMTVGVEIPEPRQCEPRHATGIDAGDADAGS